MQPSTRRGAARSTSGPGRRKAAPWWRWRTGAQGSHPETKLGSSTSSTGARARPHEVRGWGWRSAEPSSRRTAGGSGPRIDPTAARTFDSSCPSRASHLPSISMADPLDKTAEPLRPSVVLIEDEPQIRRFLRAALGGNGYRLFEASNAQEGLAEVATRRPDLVILDLGLPDLDGLSVLGQLREWSSVPVIVLSARGQERDKIAALDGGADDYVSKPFSMGELLARMRVALRRRDQVGEGAAGSVFSVGTLRVDLAGRHVQVDGKEVHLTPIEYKLLTALVRHAGKVLTHRQLLQEVWGPSRTEDSQSLRFYVAQLRRKLEAVPARPRYLLTEPGVGYRLAAE